MVMYFLRKNRETRRCQFKTPQAVHNLLISFGEIVRGWLQAAPTKDATQTTVTEQQQRVRGGKSAAGATTGLYFIINNRQRPPHVKKAA